MKITILRKNLWVLFLFLALTGCHRTRTTPSFNFGAYSEAEHSYQKGYYDKAVEKYKEYIRENPEGNMAVISEFYMAKSYEAMGQANEAQEIYEKIVKENPRLVWAEFSKTRLQELQSSAPAKES